MKNTGKKEMLIPKRRFPEFRNGPGWDQSELGAKASLLKGKGISKSDIDPNGHQPCIRYGELYTHYKEVIDSVISKTKLSANELFLSKANDVIIPSSGETKLDIATASCVLLDNVALGGDLNVIRSILCGTFLSYYLNGPQKYDIAKVAQGDTVVHLYPSQLEKLEIAFPSSAEQEKIAECLSSLDELIGAERQKLDALKAHKNGLMQQLFPIEDDTAPRLRFPEFRKAKAWRKRKISEVLAKTSIPVQVEPERTYREIGIRSHGKGVFHKEPVSGAVIADKRVFQVVEDALVLNIVFAWERAVATTSKDEVGMIASHRFPMYVPKSENCDVRFIKHALLTPQGKNLLGIASPGGAGRNRTLGQDIFEDSGIIIPGRGEQARIADCIRSVDDLIASQTANLESVKKHKRGLMQQLFPSAAEAKF